MADLLQITPYIHGWEGGLSRAVTDKAHLHPAPWSFKGLTGWHTNKGVTYQTFSSLAKQLGYANTAENFFAMPESIWIKIYRVGFWNPMSLDLVKSQAMASAMADYAWGFGVGGALKHIETYLVITYKIMCKTAIDVANAINKLTEKGDKDFFEAFIEHRKQVFKELKEPANEKGWLKRMDDLKTIGLQLISKTVTKHKGSIGTAIILGIIGLGFYYREELKQLIN